MGSDTTVSPVTSTSHPSKSSPTEATLNENGQQVYPAGGGAGIFEGGGEPKRHFVLLSLSKSNSRQLKNRLRILTL